ncbi:MAG: class IV adenylate cyclase [Candidatus Bathyarchaeota archaeon]|nr:class IV adenylate cyclase [Candidatus Bathyarchaeota archaeon]
MGSFPVNGMKEVEAKILEVDRNRVVQTLVRLGARKVFDGEIETFFLDFKDGSIVKANDLLRLRREAGRTQLTYKKVQVTEAAKVAQEFSVEVSDLAKTKQILELLGLAVTESMEKHRLSYTLDQARFDIDTYHGNYAYLPEFLEIEAQTAPTIHKYAELLGFDSKDCLPWSTQDLINHYQK